MHRSPPAWTGNWDAHTRRARHISDGPLRCFTWQALMRPFFDRARRSASGWSPRSCVTLRASERCWYTAGRPTRPSQPDAPARGLFHFRISCNASPCSLSTAWPTHTLGLAARCSSCNIGFDLPSARKHILSGYIPQSAHRLIYETAFGSVPSIGTGIHNVSAVRRGNRGS